MKLPEVATKHTHLYKAPLLVRYDSSVFSSVCIVQILDILILSVQRQYKPLAAKDFNRYPLGLFDYRLSVQVKQH